MTEDHCLSHGQLVSSQISTTQVVKCIKSSKFGWVHASAGISVQAYKQLLDYRDCTWIHCRATYINPRYHFILFYFI